MIDTHEIFWPFRLLGQIAVEHSNIEYTVASLLELLISEHTGVAAGILIEDLALARKLQHVEKLAVLRFSAPQHLDVLIEIREFLTQADKIRKSRNAFVHGRWMYDPGNADSGFIICVEGKWKHEQDDTSVAWTRHGRRKWTKEELHAKYIELRDFAKRAFLLVNQVSKRVNSRKPGNLMGRVETHQSESESGQSAPRD